jgi:hypothetical protein
MVRADAVEQLAVSCNYCGQRHTTKPLEFRNFKAPLYLIIPSQKPANTLHSRFSQMKIR